MVPFPANLSIPAAILLPSLWKRKELGIPCLLLLFFRGQDHIFVPVFFGLAGLAVLEAKTRKAFFLMCCAALLLSLVFRGGDFSAQVAMRLKTWAALLWFSSEHPFVGNGFSILIMPAAFAKVGTPLQSPHSDWLSLAFHAGWVTVGIGVLLAKKLCFPLSKNAELRAVQCSLLTFFLMALVRNTAEQMFVVQAVFWLLFRLIQIKGETLWKLQRKLLKKGKQKLLQKKEKRRRLKR